MKIKNFITYSNFLIIFILFIVAMGVGSVVKYHYDGGKKFKFLQRTIISISSIPMKFRYMIKFKTINFDKPPLLFKHKDKKKYEKFTANKRNSLLISSLYNNDLQTSIVEIIDLKNFELLHTYKLDILKMYDQISNTELHANMKIIQPPYKFRYYDPIIFEDGTLISFNHKGPIFKIDLCSNLLWINDKQQFHHTNELDHEDNIWSGVYLNPKSKYIKKYSIKNYKDDAIAKIDQNGKILFVKSVSELLIENKILPENFPLNTYRRNFNSHKLNPLHLNDIQPALRDTSFWKKNDLFLSLRNQNAIVHYRPSTNKVINYITGPFSQQHDIDIISDKEISIFNNNEFTDQNKYSEVLIYNFENKEFRKLFNDLLQKENFKTRVNGASQILKDGSLMVEESIHGRIILFNKNGEKELEYINKDKNGDIGLFTFSSIIEDQSFIKNFKKILKNKKCLN